MIRGTIIVLCLLFLPTIQLSAGGISGSVTFPSVPNYNNGAIDLMIDGGFAPFEFYWEGPGGFIATTEDITDLIAGEYCVTVTDALCGVAEDCYLLCSDDPVVLSLDGETPESCSGQFDGALFLSHTGVLAYPWNIQVDEGQYGYDNVNGEIAWWDVSAGTHCITITDVCNTNVVACFDVGAVEYTLQISSDITHVCQNSQGEIVSSVQITEDPPGFSRGNNLPLIYTWNNGAITPTISDLPPGTYCLTVADQCGNSANECYEVHDFNDAGFIESVYDVTTCEAAWQGGDETNTMDGSIDISVNVPNGFYISNLVWTGPNGFNSTQPDISNLEPGIYLLTVSFSEVGSSSIVCNIVMDAVVGCCEFEEVEEAPNGNYVTITYSQETIIELTEIISSPDGSCTGSIDITALSRLYTSHGLGQSTNFVPGTYTYLWSSPDNGFTSNEEDISGLCPGAYCVTVNDGCNDISECYEIVNCSENPIYVSGAIMNYCTANCNGTTQVFPGSITLGISGGEAPYSYLWSNGETTNPIQNLSPGSYRVTVSDVHGCFGYAEFDVQTGTPMCDREGCVIITTCDGQVVHTNNVGLNPMPVFDPLDCRYAHFFCNDGVFSHTEYIGITDVSEPDFFCNVDLFCDNGELFGTVQGIACRNNCIFSVDQRTSPPSVISCHYDYCYFDSWDLSFTTAVIEHPSVTAIQIGEGGCKLDVSDHCTGVYGGTLVFSQTEPCNNLSFQDGDCSDIGLRNRTWFQGNIGSNGPCDHLRPIKGGEEDMPDILMSRSELFKDVLMPDSDEYALFEELSITKIVAFESTDCSSIGFSYHSDVTGLTTVTAYSADMTEYFKILNESIKGINTIQLQKSARRAIYSDTSYVKIEFPNEVVVWEQLVFSCPGTSNWNKDKNVTNWMEIMPNPFDNEITLYFKEEHSDKRPEQVYLLTLDGSVVLEQRILTERVIIRTTDIPSGVYYLNVKSGNEYILSHKVIKR